MKERPILFTGPMVQAIQEGRKVQTRRIIKLPWASKLGQWEASTVGGEGTFTIGARGERKATQEQACIWHTRSGKVICSPYGKPGEKAFTTTRPTETGWYDVIFHPGESHSIRVYLHVTEWGICWGWNEADDPEAIEVDVQDPDKIEFRKCADQLWVRETFCMESNLGIEDESTYPPPFNDGRPINRPEGDDGPYWEQAHYRATDPAPELSYDDMDEPGCRWKPSIHMPRWASRLQLEVTAIRVERVQDITEDDARAEGRPFNHRQSPKTWFMALWDSINAKRDNGAYAWANNPWVWVIEFKKIEKGE